LEHIREEAVPFVKNSVGKEPTFENIYRLLKKNDCNDEKKCSKPPSQTSIKTVNSLKGEQKIVSGKKKTYTDQYSDEYYYPHKSGRSIVMFKKRAKNQSYEEFIQEYKNKFKDYEIEIEDWSLEKTSNKITAAEVTIKTKDGTKYATNFYTNESIGHIFKHHSRTGEFLNGLYLCSPGMIIVRKIDENTIKKVINDLIDGSSIYRYFE
jgi:hypothetical protein